MSLYSGEIEYDNIEIWVNIFFTFGPKSPIFSGPVHTLIMDENSEKKSQQFLVIAEHYESLGASDFKNFQKLSHPNPAVNNNVTTKTSTECTELLDPATWL